MRKGAEEQGSRGAGKQKSGELVTLGCLALLTLVLLRPIVLHPTDWLWKPGAQHSDLAVSHWPNAHFTRRALWQEGRFPLWRPTIMSGTPFAANPLAGLYYPPNWLFLFTSWLPLELGFNLSALLHLWLAGAAMYALMLHGFGVGAWGALVAGVAYEASPKLLAHLSGGHVGWTQAWAWLPLVVLCTVQVCRWQVASGKWASGPVCTWAVGGGIALAMQFCADVRMAAYTLAAIVALMLASAIHHSTFNVRNSLFAIRTFAIFLGLTACQWLPMVALLPHTTRASMTMDEAAIWSLPWRHLIGLLLANHGGFHEWMTYLGVSTLALAWLGARYLWQRQAQRWIAAWMVGLTLFAAWFSLGENGGLFQVLWRVVPGLGLLRVPPRAWVLVNFAAAALVGWGMEAISREQGAGSGQRARRERRLRLAIASFPPMLAVGYWLAIGTPPLNLVMFGLVTPLTVALVSFRSRSLKFQAGAALKPETIRSGALVLLIAVDLLIVDATLVEARPSEEVFAPGREAAKWLAAQPDRFRVYSPSYSIPQHVAERYSLHLADGVDPLQLRAYADHLTLAAGLEPQGYAVTLPPFPKKGDVRTALKDVAPNVEMLGQLGVRYIASAFTIRDPRLQLQGQFDDVYVYRNEGARAIPTEPKRSIVLSDGTVLYRYRPWPVYAGWAISSATMIGLLMWIAIHLRKRSTDA